MNIFIARWLIFIEICVVFLSLSNMLKSVYKFSRLSVQSPTRINTHRMSRNWYMLLGSVILRPMDICHCGVFYCYYTTYWIYIYITVMYNKEFTIKSGMIILYCSFRRTHKNIWLQYYLWRITDGCAIAFMIPVLKFSYFLHIACCL